VLSWLDSGRIDMAVLSPTMYAEVLRVDPRGRHLHTACRYLATEGVAPAPDYEWVSADRKKKGQYHFSYRSVCLVPHESDLNTFAHLKKAFEAASLQFVSVRPTAWRRWRCLSRTLDQAPICRGSLGWLNLRRCLLSGI
jgi:hypothetical protein